MTRPNLKKMTIGALVMVAFVFGICINPADDSQTFFADFFKVKAIAGIAVLVILLINRYWNTNNNSSISQTI